MLRKVIFTFYLFLAKEERDFLNYGGVQANSRTSQLFSRVLVTSYQR